MHGRGADFLFMKESKMNDVFKQIEKNFEEIDSSLETIFKNISKMNEKLTKLTKNKEQKNG